MKRRRRVEITIHRREVTFLHSLDTPLRLRCSECRCDVNMLSVPLAASAAGVTPRTLYRWVEAHRVHFREATDGTVLICQNSLPCA
jgi:hypothetical protein